MRLLSRISVRLLLFNVLLVFLPAAGFLYLDTYERQLLTAQERSMVLQGRLLAAALAERGELEAGEAVALLTRLERRLEARLRVLDRAGRTLADSALLGPRQDEPASGPGRTPYDSGPEARESPLYRLGAVLYRLWDRAVAPSGPAREPAALDDPRRPLLGPEVRAALAGRYGAATRPAHGGERALILYSAIPVRSGGEVVGVVLVSQSTSRILRALWEVRLGIFEVFLGSVAVAAILSLLVSATIARPLRRLSDEANALLDRRGRLRGSFRGSTKADEIGDLARALERLTRRLETHQRSLEAFAADVSHEFKNPLAAIRGATEMLAEVDDPADRRRFLGVAEREVARMERLLSGVREITSLDARLEDEAAPPIDLAALVAEVVDGVRPRARRGVAIELAAPGPVLVRAAPERLAQVLENVLDNAVSFSPEGGTVTVAVAREDGAAVVRVDDEGPGIPEAHRARIFDRFFTWRPAEPHARNGHTGLGLAIAKAVAEGYGGAITAANRPDGGARFEVRLPGVTG